MALAKAKKIVSSAPVVVFSKTNSGHCKWLKELLIQLEASFKVIELDLESDGSDIQSALTEWTGQRQLPIIFIGGNHIGGCESTENFFSRMLQALEDASVAMVDQKHDVIKKFELSTPTVDSLRRRSPSPADENHSTSSEPVGDSEDQEVTDSDDDRNHKHRRREAQPNSFDNDVQEQSRWTDRKRSKPFEGRHMSHDSDNRGNMLRGISSKFEKRPTYSTPGIRVPPDLGSRARLNQMYRVDSVRRSDVPASIGRPSMGRGRGRSTISWVQQESKFSPLDTLDFASQVVSQGLPANHGLFVGAGIPNAASTQNASWGAYGFVPGMSNNILDPLQPLGIQGALQPMMTPIFNMGIPRQRCRDFDERGFCLRGDMCPMDHGVNRIVVEDVQSLSQFNLPVSDPSSQGLGLQAGSGSLPSVSTSSGHFNSCKPMTVKDGKSMLTDDALKLNGVSSASGVAEADVYDPDQPLWNSEPSQTPSTCLMLPSPNNDEEPLNVDFSAKQSLKLSNGFRTEQANRNFPYGSNSSVWGRNVHGCMSEMGFKTNGTLISRSPISDEMKEDHERLIVISAIQQKSVSAKEMENKPAVVQSHPTLNAESGRNTGRVSHKASCTLYVHGIPQKNNTKSALLSHFQKFGEVVDVYIPLNSEKAFVQFSRREEAEAALEAPDAVMGNRFIKLWWANRDRVHDVRKNSVQKKIPLSSSLGASFSSNSSSTDKEKGNLASPSPTGNKTSIFSATPGAPKCPSSNIPKVAPPVQKKLEGLELLKEELRKKQDILAQKRDEFRRQLVKFEKQAVSVKKGELASGQTAKRLKVDLDNEPVASSAPISTAGAQEEAENKLQKQNSVQGFVSPTPIANNTEEMDHLQTPKSSTVGPDNLPTSFRILPPLPDGLKDVAVLQDHFSSFGDLSSVVFEDSEGRTDNDGMGTREDSCACVIFTSHLSAERAYVSGNCWKGHRLRFMWLSDSGNSDKKCSIQDTIAPHGSSSSDVQAELALSLTSFAKGNSSNSVIAKTNDVINGDSRDIQEEYCAQSNPPEAFLMETHSNPDMREECHPGNDAPVVEGKTNVGLAQ
ncbi:hypothetical protein Cni_G10466 [Canna indica]|uniref:Zinc finger CCCH domain-containing protein 27 n=1 Tax=Canna indica TaxID=4628 RepID=A0AAQ3K447_9LILI|nr:hypothetical protein Cni_G10466 [Canna indica]